jgi:hypothetical protein
MQQPLLLSPSLHNHINITDQIGINVVRLVLGREKRIDQTRMDVQISDTVVCCTIVVMMMMMMIMADAIFMVGGRQQGVK